MLTGIARRAGNSIATCMVFASVAAAQFDAPRARLTETLRISGGEEDLTRVGMIFVDAAGRIGITQPQDARVLLYSVDGRKLRSIGTRGNGPGEFQTIENAGWIGDTLWIVDGPIRKISAFTSTGKYVRSLSLLSVSADPKFTAIPKAPAIYRPAALLPAGYFVASRRGRSRDATTIVRISPDNQVDRVLVHHPPSNAFIEVPTGRGMSYASVPYINDAIDLIAPDGNRVAFLSTQVSGPRTEVRLLVVTSRGDSIVRRTYPFSGVAISQGEKDSVIAARLRSMQGPSTMFSATGVQQTVTRKVPQAELDATAAAMRASFPSVQYPITTGQLGVDNTIWVQLRTVSGVVQWAMLNERGDPELTVVLPPRTRIALASRTTLWTIQVDDDDLPNVVRYAITK